jgi:hypothetical protein
MRSDRRKTCGVRPPIEGRVVDALRQYRTVVTRRAALTVLAGGMTSAAGGGAPATCGVGAEPENGCSTAGYRDSEHVNSYYAVCRLREPPC